MATAAPAAPPHLLTYREFAKAIATSERTLADWVKDGKVKAVRLGAKSVRFHPSELERVQREGVAAN
jgi:excisionase family DNA binding protein